ncbi:MAG: PorV/PorQ family protein [Bacteroidota bacterium]
MKFTLRPLVFMPQACLIVIAIVLFSTPIRAQLAPKYSNEFLAIGVGARGLSMANCQVSAVNDVTSGYWNPAGLLRLKAPMQAGLMHSEYFAGIAKYDFAGFAKRIDSSSVVGVSIIRFGVDDIPNTTELIDAQGNWDYDRITTFGAADYAFIFSYARDLGIENLRVGGNAKIVRRKVGDFGGAWGFGLDAGLQYDYKSWNFAAMVRDVTSTFNAWSFNLSDEVKDVFTTTGNELPDNGLEITLPKMILGAARTFSFSEKFTLLAELDMDWTFDGKRNVLIKSNPLSIDPHLGIELGFKNMIFLRSGIGNMQYVTDFVGKKTLNIQPNFGVGVRIKSITVDYAFTDIGDASVALYSNIFSLKFDLNKKPD